MVFTIADCGGAGNEVSNGSRSENTAEATAAKRPGGLECYNELKAPEECGTHVGWCKVSKGDS